ncbi:potassium channel family protein [Aeromicrobium ginsengisoli]|uniref:TrkA family potassium uptake protein n=1 Tax=Aeromicrobium ginsengisoli TaxID=363867 RepID=A0A5M4FJ20_9ACTN|nr:TrkA family potassium uptake protein [Aeromicrobium ginsengisoli]KAA1399972.1 TrkA family potassium uptake protein [Aeromicrobium ginsengisoli]
MAKSAQSPTAPVLVIGLGRFGSSVAKSLVRLGHEVLAVDERPDIVQKFAGDFTHVVSADTTDTEALRQIGAEQFRRAVVGIGTDIEASVLTVLSLSDLGVAEIWAKAISGKHASILERVGATHVVRPEADMGKRVAHLVTGTMTDYIEFDDGFAIARTRTPQVACGKTLAESGLRQAYGITVVGVKTRGEDFTYARPETPISHADELIVSGPTTKVEAFCALP